MARIEGRILHWEHRSYILHLGDSMRRKTALSDSQGESGTPGHDTSHGTGGAKKSSSRRLMLLTIIMVGFAALTFLPSLFQRSTQEIFIPVWLTLTIATVIISMWFAKYLMTYEKYRDSETATPAAPVHPH
jgi:hypothetical protein